MRPKKENLFDLLSLFPWWVSIVMGVAIFFGIKVVLPLTTGIHPLFQGIASISQPFAPLTMLFLFPAAASALGAKRKRRLLDQQSGLESIRALSWKEFEELLGEAYRRQGYTVKENHGSGPDGGVDLTLRKDGNLYLVQCKQWRTFKVGVKVVREMFGLMTAEQANGVIIVTSGLFTQEARTFAAGKPIDLLEGNKLAEMVGTIQPPVPRIIGQQESPPQKKCPQCHGELIVREARRGHRAGEKFWGCAAYPRCRYSENIPQGLVLANESRPRRE